MIKTFDGELHHNETIATQHVIDKCCDWLENLILVEDNISKADQVKIISSIVKDVTYFNSIINRIHEALNYE